MKSDMKDDNMENKGMDNSDKSMDDDKKPITKNPWFWVVIVALVYIYCFDNCLLNDRKLAQEQRLTPLLLLQGNIIYFVTFLSILIYILSSIIMFLWSMRFVGSESN